MRLQVLQKILDERDQLLLARLKVRLMLAEIEARDRQLTRELLDRKAAGRVFQQNVAVPMNDDAYESRDALDAAMAELRGGLPWVPGESTPTQPEQIDFDESDDTPRQSEAGVRISDLILEHLRQAGDKGTTANAIRSWLLNVHGISTHEKTPGMTLYRLSKQGSVTRNGRTWFLSSAPAEKGNPGSEPGLPKT